MRALLVQSVNNTEVSFPSITCIHHEFVCQVMNHPQKLAVELDEQSLTYSELLYYVQLLSLNLLNKHKVMFRRDYLSMCRKKFVNGKLSKKYLFMLM